MAVVACPCQNISLHLNHSLASQETPFWLGEHFKLPKGVGKGTLVSNGVVTQVPLLSTLKEVERDTQIWTCLMCNNCETFIYAEENTGSAPLLINKILQQVHDNGINQLSSTYSPVWKIVLKEDEEANSSIIEPPPVEDEQRYHQFKLLQTQLQNFLEEEEMAMKKRIREFEQKQMEALRELNTRAYRDRKKLWFQIDRELSSLESSSTNDGISKESSDASNWVKLAPKKKTPLIAVSSKSIKLGSKENRDENTAAPVDTKSVIANPWINSRVSSSNRINSSTEWLFQFDDDKSNTEVEEAGGGDQEELSGEDFDLDDEVEDQTVDGDTTSWNFVPEDRQSSIAASLPVQIPMQLSERGMIGRRDFDNSLSPPRPNKIRSTFQTRSAFDTPESRTNADDELLSKSFAIPQSRNRVKGWM